MNYQFFKFQKRKLQNDCENDHTSFRQTNELIGYQNSADFCEIWPEHSLDVVKQKCNCKWFEPRSHIVIR